VVLLHDLTEHQQIEAVLREARFRVMANYLPLLVWLHDAQGRQAFVTPTFCEWVCELWRRRLLLLKSTICVSKNLQRPVDPSSSGSGRVLVVAWPCAYSGQHVAT
jgi:hypothetical protein